MVSRSFIFKYGFRGGYWKIWVGWAGSFLWDVRLYIPPISRQCNSELVEVSVCFLIGNVTVLIGHSIGDYPVAGIVSVCVRMGYCISVG